MEKKSKSLNLFRRAILGLLGHKGIYAFTSFILKRRFRVPDISFPVKISDVKEILIILPEEQIDVLYQLQNVIGLSTLFKHAGVTLVCEHHITSMVKMISGLNIIEYDANARRAFTKEFTGLVREFRGNVDICFLLDHKPDIGLLYLAGATAAPVRVGYYGAGKYPFLNLQIAPSKDKKYLPERNSSIVDIFGSKPKGVSWNVAPKIIDEIDHLLRESKLKSKSALIGIDALFLMRRFGREWAGQFLSRFKQLNKGEIYIYAEQAGSGAEQEWIRAQQLPVLTNLTESRTAALVSRSDLVITGNTLLYVIAGLLNRPALGFFHENEIDSFCPQSQIHKGISFRGNSEKENTEILEQAVYLFSKFHFKAVKEI